MIWAGWRCSSQLNKGVEIHEKQNVHFDRRSAGRVTGNRGGRSDECLRSGTRKQTDARARPGRRTRIGTGGTSGGCRGTRHDHRRTDHRASERQDARRDRRRGRREFRRRAGSHPGIPRDSDARPHPAGPGRWHDHTGACGLAARGA